MPRSRRIAKSCVLALIPLALATTGMAGQAPPDCSQKFLATWLWNRPAALAMLPKRPCLLHGEHDQYICDRSGCVAKH